MHLGVWKIEEEESFFHDNLMLDDEELQYLNKIKVSSKRLQWLASRLLVRKIVNPPGRILMDWNANGKPYVINYDIELSVSHCDDLAAVLVGNSQCGIDIEKKTEKIERIASKFMREDEEQFVFGQFRRDYLLIIWGMKETLFKKLGGGGIDFRKHLRVMPFNLEDRGVVTMQFLKYEPKEYSLHYQMNDEYVLVYSI